MAKFKISMIFGEIFENLQIKIEKNESIKVWPRNFRIICQKNISGINLKNVPKSFS